MGHRIVTATDDDLDVLVRLNGIVQGFHAEQFPDLFKTECDPQEVGAYFRKTLDTGRFEATLYLADASAPHDQAIGFALFELQDIPESCFTHPLQQGFLHQIAVDPSARRQGVARALLTDMRARLSGRGITKIAADVFAANDRAQAFFETEGLMPMRHKLEGPVGS